MHNNIYLDVAPEVKAALDAGRAVVALESTIISHGMPYPQNVQTARNVEQIIRSEGAVPATIAVIGGKMKVGLSPEEIEYLGKKGVDVTKASRRDLPVLAAKGMDGATTVASTMIIAAMAGIKIFATGGIGGVHRGAETTMDISADLDELGRTDVTVICAGAKSILDIGLTLEYLETKGVPVIGFGTNELPAFYCRESGFGVDYRIDTPEELAKAVKAKHDLGIHGGILVGNPVPKEFAMPKAMADRAINIAVEKAKEHGIKGKQLTPFLLALVKEMTGGQSLDANIELVYNNARVAAKTAVCLAELEAGISGEESIDELRAEIADDTAESIGHEMEAFRAEIEAMLAQRMAMPPMFMNPYQAYAPQTPYQQAPFGQNPYQAQPQPQQIPYAPFPQPGQYQQAQQAQPPFVNPYAPQHEPAPQPMPAPHPPVYKSVPDEQWVNPFAPKHESPEAEQPQEVPAGGDAPLSEPVIAEEPAVIEEPAPEVMEMIDGSEAAEKVSAEEMVLEEAAVPETEAEAEAAEADPADGYAAEEIANDAITEVSPSAEAVPEEKPEDDGSELTEYVSPVKDKKKRKPENQEKPEMDGEGLTAYDPGSYRKKAEDRKQRLAEAAGEAKHSDEAKTAEPEYIDCKGPLEFTGEHPWAWKCTRCGQIFQKHEIPHKCIKTD